MLGELRVEATPSSADSSLSDYQDFTSDTCALQRNITEEALRHFAHDNFEARWMKAGGRARAAHPRYCPEIRLMRLRLDGKVFINLVKAVMLPDASFIPSQPIYVSHAGWDAWAAGLSKESDAEKITFAEIQVLRTKFVCHIVQFTLRSFFNKDAPRLVVRKEHRSIQNPKIQRPSATQARAAIVAELGKEAAKARLKEEKAGVKARHSERLGHCSYLGCHNFEPEDGLLECKPTRWADVAVTAVELRLRC
ncbi:hypothetical protein C8R47DRAFT_1212292 [Mycena vitilis]|nr:hypothetical protein C8R47DRAFT_1212292 [Mycena vitilis]